jgi:hypothetical protein
VLRSIGALLAVGAVALAVPRAVAAAGAAAEVVVETLGESLRGKLVSIDNRGLALATEGRDVVVPREDLLFVTRPLATGRADEAPEGGPGALGEVALVDGSRVPYSDSSIADGVLSLGQRRGDGTAWRVETPIDGVAWWRARPASSAAVNRQWRDIVDRPSTSDAVVVARGGGESLDFVEGVIQRVDAEGVRFVLDGEAVDVPWPRVFGLVFFRPSPPSVGEAASLDGAATRVTIEGDEGLRLVGDSITLDSAELTLASGPGRAAIGLDAVRRIDCSAGKLAYASRLPVLRREWTPRLAAGPTLPGEPVADRAFGGAPLALRFPDPRAAGLWFTRTFEHGWAVRSRGVVELRLPAGARRLRGWVGIDPATSATGRMVARIAIEGRTLLEAKIDGQTAPIAINEQLDSPESAERTLTLEVDYGENLDTGDHAHFADLRVTR